MKKVLKKIFTTLGIWSLARKIALKTGIIRHTSPLEKYQDIDTWLLNYRGLTLSYDTSDPYSKRWFFPRYDGNRIHEPLATDIFIDHIEADSIVLDIGGHLGYFSCISGALAHSGQVHVFEVDPKCLRLIDTNLRKNKLDNVTVHNYAISDKPGSVKIPQFKNPNPSLIIDSASSENYLEVDSLVIDNFLSENHIQPDFIKIDIEGAEFKALQGMQNFLERNQPIILVEVHVEILRKNFKTEYTEILSFLKNHGYKILEVEHRNEQGQMREIHLDSHLEGNTMLLCTKNA